MVSPKSFLALGWLLFNSAGSGISAQETNPGPIIKAEYNPTTGDVDVFRAPVENAKRGYPPQAPSCPSDVRSLASLLRSKREQEFCKRYVDIHPVVYKTITVTTCGKHNPNCTPQTVTTIVPRTRTLTNIVTADTPTVTKDVTATESVVKTDTITITSTVGTPLTTPAPVQRRGKNNNQPNVPGYLKNCPPGRLSAACSSLIDDYIKTTTIKKTTTITQQPRTVKSTVTLTVATRTQTLTITPQPTTFTTTVATVTITVIAPEKSTTTTTICPSATIGVSGISVDSPGHLEGAAANTVVDCCTACYNAPSCAGWAYLGTNFCFYAVDGPPNSGTPTAQCPSGLGTFFLATGGPQELAGGPGPCLQR